MVSYVIQTTRISFPVGRRRPQRLRRTLILISAIAKSSPFHYPRRLADCNDRILVGHMEEGGPTLHSGWDPNPSTHTTWSYHNCRRCPHLQALSVHNICKSLERDECLPFRRLYQRLWSRFFRSCAGAGLMLPDVNAIIRYPP